MYTMQDLNKESKRISRYRARMDAVDKWMGKHHLPKSLRTRIGHHYQEVVHFPYAAFISDYPFVLAKLLCSFQSHPFYTSTQSPSQN